MSVFLSAIDFPGMPDLGIPRIDVATHWALTGFRSIETVTPQDVLNWKATVPADRPRALDLEPTTDLPRFMYYQQIFGSLFDGLYWVNLMRGLNAAARSFLRQGRLSSYAYPFDRRLFLSQANGLDVHRATHALLREFGAAHGLDAIGFDWYRWFGMQGPLNALDLNLSEARKFGRPLDVYLSPYYADIDGPHAGEMIDPDSWIHDVRDVRRRLSVTDGDRIVIWATGAQSWDPSWPWIDRLRREINA